MFVKLVSFITWFCTQDNDVLCITHHCLGYRTKWWKKPTLQTCYVMLSVSCGSFHCIDRDMGSGWLSTRARLCRVVGKKGVELVSFALYVYGVCHQVCVFSHQLRSSSSHGWQVWRTVEHPSDHMIPGQVTHQSTCLHGISQHQSHSMLWRRHMSTTPIVKVSLHHLVWPLLSEEVSHEQPSTHAAIKTATTEYFRFGFFCANWMNSSVIRVTWPRQSVVPLPYSLSPWVRR